MTSIFAPYRCTAANVLGAIIGLIVGMSATFGHAQGRLKAHYTISMTGVSIGQIVWLVAVGDQRYSTTANGKASGVLSVLVNGEGSVDTRGNIDDGRLAPKFFTSNITDDEGKSELRMTFEDGVAKDQIGQASPLKADRVPVTDAHRRGVADPLTAMLIADGGDALAYSMLVKYVAGRRDMELWFAPITGTSIIAPIRVLMPTLIGTLEIAADQFDGLVTPPSPVTPAPAETPR